MSKLRILINLDKDIELLENYGDYKSANILYKKFLRIAQTRYPYPDDTPPDATPIPPEKRSIDSNDTSYRDYSDLLNDLNMNYNNSYFTKFYQEYLDNINFYPDDEKNYLNAGVKRILRQRERENLSKPQVQKNSYTPGSVGENATNTDPYLKQFTAPVVEEQATPFSDENWNTYNNFGYAGPGSGITTDSNPWADPNWEKYNPNNYKFDSISETPMSNVPEQTTEGVTTNTTPPPTLSRLTEAEEESVKNKILRQIHSLLMGEKVEEANKLIKDYSDFFTFQQPKTSFRMFVEKWLRDKEKGLLGYTQLYKDFYARIYYNRNNKRKLKIVYEDIRDSLKLTEKEKKELMKIARNLPSRWNLNLIPTSMSDR